ncbi:MAG TPA: CinA family protein [Firmicutes bacterium]|nr:CinA family protein [Bacillota bacterium]
MINRDKAEKVIKAFAQEKLTLGSVESLTGGLFASTLCSIPGASQVFRGGLVTYAADLKTKLDNVPERIIREYGVVSKEVADSMAINGRKTLNTDVCVSFTGNAGPTKEEGFAPVGRVNMCIATKYGIIEMQQDFDLSRNEMREACVDMMLDRLIAIFED